MAGYAASARLRGEVPRFVRLGSGAPLSTGFDGEAIRRWLDASDQIELVGRPLDQRLADWLASLGEAWSQMTFYLFDPQSWR